MKQQAFEIPDASIYAQKFEQRYTAEVEEAAQNLAMQMVQKFITESATSTSLIVWLSKSDVVNPAARYIRDPAMIARAKAILLTKNWYLDDPGSYTFIIAPLVEKTKEVKAVKGTKRWLF